MVQLLAALVRDGEVWVVVWPPDRSDAALRVVGQWAANPDLRFTWYDAAAMCRQIRSLGATR